MAAPIRIKKLMPIGGLHTALPADIIDDLKTPNAINVHFRFGTVKPRPGVGLSTPPPTAEQVLWLGSFATTTGVIWRLMLMQTKLYRWGNTTPGSPAAWYEITGPGFTKVDRWWTTVGEGYFFFVSGVGIVYRWNGNSASPYEAVPIVEGAAIWATYVKGKFIEYYNYRVVVAYTQEAAGVTYPNRLRWPESLNHTLWDDTAGEGAGFIDLYEGGGESPITGIAGLQDKLVVYMSNHIVDVVATGSTDLVFVAQTRVRGIGCIAPWSLASNGVQHFFIAGDGNVYAWDGLTLDAIGDSIRDQLRSLLSPDQVSNYFSCVSFDRDEYWLVLGNDNVFVYDYRRQTWTRDTFPDITALAELKETVGTTTWDLMTGTWDQQTLPWEKFLGTSVVTMYGGRSTGDVYRIDEEILGDYFAIGCIVDKIIETRDFYLSGDDPFMQATTMRVLLAYDYVNSNPFEVGVSNDRGSTWSTRQVTPEPRGYSLIDFVVTGNVTRFRFRENSADGNFRWRHYTIDAVHAGPISA